MSNNYEIQDQNLHLTTSNQMFELDDNELENIAGGKGGKHRKPENGRHGKPEDPFRKGVLTAARFIGRRIPGVGVAISAYQLGSSDSNNNI